MARYITLHYPVSLCTMYYGSAQHGIVAYSNTISAIIIFRLINTKSAELQDLLPCFSNTGPYGNVIQVLQSGDWLGFIVAAISVVCCVTLLLSSIELPVLIQEDCKARVSLAASIQHAIKDLCSEVGKGCNESNYRGHKSKPYIIQTAANNLICTVQAAFNWRPMSEHLC